MSALRFHGSAQSKIYIPETKEEWEALKDLLIFDYGLEDKPETWTFVLSHLQGVKMPVLTILVRDIVDHYKRWKIAAVLQTEKMVYIEQLKDKLNKCMEAVASNGSTPSGEQVQSGASDSEGIVPILPTPQENLVSEPSW